MKKIFTAEMLSKVVFEVILFGVVVFFIQGYFQNKWAPLTAAETLKKENFLNSKREVYFEAIELVNRHIGHGTLSEPGKQTIHEPRYLGSKYPSEFEVNTCFSKLCIYSDNKKIILLFKKILLDSTSPIADLEDFINLVRSDLGYGMGVISLRTNEYQYIQIVRKDSTK